MLYVYDECYDIIGINGLGDLLYNDTVYWYSDYIATQRISICTGYSNLYGIIHNTHTTDLLVIDNVIGAWCGTLP